MLYSTLEWPQVHGNPPAFGCSGLRIRGVHMHMWPARSPVILYPFHTQLLPVPYSACVEVALCSSFDVALHLGFSSPQSQGPK